MHVKKAVINLQLPFAITIWRLSVGNYQPLVISPQLPKAEAEGSGDLRVLPKNVGTEVAFARTGRCSRHSDVNLRYPHIWPAGAQPDGLK
jgi:hypothetical protein